MKIENISNKIIGIGDITILPGEIKTIPVNYEHSPVLNVYQKCKLAKVTGEPIIPAKTSAEIVAEKAEAEKKVIEDAEKLRKERLAMLEGASEETIAKLADELGINPAECKDQADVLKKVKAALKK